MDERIDGVAGKTMATKIADRIRDDIISRNIRPGSRITIKEIADRYGVSSMPVREAFNMLCGEQLLEMNPYRGATVMAVTPELMAQLNDVQSALESLLVELCLRKGYPQELLARLEEINREIAALENDETDLRERRIALNTEFHTLEYSPCQDHMAYGLFRRTLNQLIAIRRYHVMELSRVKETAQEHDLIIRALRNNDVVTAVAITKLHTQNAKRYALTVESYED